MEVLKPNAQILTIKDTVPESTLTEEAENKLNKIEHEEKTVDREKLAYRTNEYTYAFKIFWIISTFGWANYCKITLKEANKYQSSLLVEIINFKKERTPIIPGVFDAFERKIFPIKTESKVFQTTSLAILIWKYELLNKCFKNYH